MLIVSKMTFSMFQATNTYDDAQIFYRGSFPSRVCPLSRDFWGEMEIGHGAGCNGRWMFQLQKGHDDDGGCCGWNLDDMLAVDSQQLVEWVGFDSSGCQ